MAADPAALAAALAPPHALGTPALAVRLRSVPEDFVVEEELGFAPAGSGAHLLLRVRKVNANTHFVARRLALLAGCRAAEVGFAGLKDRRAVAVQWFSVPQPRRPLEWCGLGEAEFTVLEAHPHTRKLPRGALAGNRFAIRLRPLAGSGAALAATLAPALARVGAAGVPNYFGPQRFGRDGANLAHIGADLARLPPAQRGFVLSAARALIFNAVLAARVAAGSWDALQAGDLACLDGRGSIFPVVDPDETLRARARALEIHPTGPLWGAGSPPSGAAIAALEAHSAAAHPAAAAACSAAGMRQERRSLRLAVRELRAESEAAALVLHFRLARGSFATAVLRELITSAAELAEE